MLSMLLTIHLRIHREHSKNSKIQFLEDYCLVRLNGTISDFSITFGGRISEKKVSAMLPDNYVLPVQEKDKNANQ